jgi:phage terminase large subunit GpA-like protein
MTTTPTIDRRAAHRRAVRSTVKIVRSHLRPRPRLTLSQWSERYRVLSRESSAEPGPWKNDRVPYLVEVQDVISGSEYQDITIVKSSQTAGTEALNNMVGFCIDQEPSPVLMIQPNVKPMAEAWSKDRLAPMLRDSPRLRGKVKDPRARDSGNTMLHKSFAGGYITIMGANSPAGLASRPIRVVLADELDRWTDSAGTEGDPLSLAEARTITFRHRSKIVKVSTPGNEGESRIEKEWERSDQRHYYVPCPHCAEMQPLEYRDTAGKPGITMGRGDFRLVWDKDVVDGVKVHRPETAGYLCRACNCIIEEIHKAAMLAGGKWVKHNPTSARAGFHISGLLSPWVRWSQIATEWLAKKDDHEQRKTFINTKLGLLYTEDGDLADPSKLTGRRESWSAVPNNAGLLLMTVDVQGDRLEVLVTAWGADEECWLIHHEKLFGDPEQPDVWERLEAIRVRPWEHESGATMHVRLCGVDAGYLTTTVMQWVKQRQGAGVFALMGSDDLKTAGPSQAKRANRDKVKMFSFNPTKFKDMLFGRLRRASAGAGYVHIGPESTGIDEAFLLQFGAEKRIVDYKNGVPKVRYVLLAGRRNEAIDLLNQSLVLLRTLGDTFVRSLGSVVASVQAEGAKLKAEREQKGDGEDEQSRPAPVQQRRGSSWVNGWK